MPHDDSTYANIKAHPLIDGYARLGIDLAGRYLVRRRRRGGYRSAGRDDADLFLRWGVLGPVNTAGGHALAYPLGTRLKLPHGLANAIIFPHVLAFNASACPDKTAGVASMLGLGAGARANDILTSAMDYCQALGIEMRLSRHGAQGQDLPIWAEEAFAIKRLIDNNPRPLGSQDILSIYRSAL
ncbi:iron-containing alcohol dehydrogenase [Mesorhizobium sp. M6A.T.Ce.TU.016.01.1.1]|uniref:iron-containing alcohol dehydrogenase n=1 Tax=Mesorhizobium sp. M6A.T.Ce.TU.016.01.1.1 TaxID=2496783 RepID=UPI000FCBC719|nr:iron-containing alcohol dehydrogenase [Mesorhizobium sp. M6A.T.Ce.TU.016.01.1.1]RUU30694.1 iron-containing alcohol dehydrogenase [Mesorhizobium sp. M6A.T.Ce.TU.016.01.1.1]